MGWRFRKSFRLAPGVRLNLSKRGVGASFGIPGTGLSYSVSPGRARRSPTHDGGCAGCLLIAIAMGVAIYFQNGSPRSAPPEPLPAVESQTAVAPPATTNPAETAPPPAPVAPPVRSRRRASRPWGLAELGLCVLLSGCGAAGGYLLHSFLQGRQNAQAEEARIAKLKRFRTLLVEDLRRGALDKIEFDLQASLCAVPRADADAVADELYLMLARSVLDDGVVITRERLHLTRVAKALQIDIDRAAKLEDVARHEHYQQAYAAAGADGALTPGAAARLEELRIKLGIRPGEHRT